MNRSIYGVITALSTLIPNLGFAVTSTANSVYLTSPSGSVKKAIIDGNKIIDQQNRPIADGIYMRPDGTRIQVQHGVVLQSAPAAGPILPSNRKILNPTGPANPPSNLPMVPRISPQNPFPQTPNPALPRSPTNSTRPGTFTNPGSTVVPGSATPSTPGNTR